MTTILNKQTTGHLNELEVSNLIVLKVPTKEVNFQEVSICGLVIPSMTLEKLELNRLEEYLISDGLLREDRCLLIEMECKFYKQMVHGVAWDLRRNCQSRIKKYA